MSKKPILYVDIEKQNLTVFKFSFDKLYDVSVANSAKDGLEILKKKEISVIISDQKLSDQSGVEFFESVVVKFPDATRILLDESNDLEVAISAINRGQINYYIKKPWDAIELKKVIDKALEDNELKKNSSDQLEKTQDNNIELNAVNKELKVKLSDLRGAREKAEANERLKAAFIGNLLKEIRLPLNRILNFVETLVNECVTDSQKLQYKESIETGSESLLKLIDDFIIVSELELDEVNVNIGVIRINTFLSKIVGQCNAKKEKAGKSDVNVELLAGGDNTLIIITDEFLLKKVFEKLFDNALKFTEKGTITIGYDHLKRERKIMFFVKDTGAGIAKEKEELISNTFKNVDEDPIKFYEGTGLGLSICKGYIELLDGDIRHESEPGKGAEFFFTLSM